MGAIHKDQIIIVGCGRMGVELAQSIARQNYAVTVVDQSARAFDRLGPDFRGRMVQGEAFDREALVRAGIESAHAFAAVTASDSANIVSARIARDIFHVEHVVARVYNPRRAVIYEKLGLQTIMSSSWAAKRIEQIILHPGLQSIYTVGHGEVQIFEISVPDDWQGRALGDLLPGDSAIPVALTRGGRALLPSREMPLQTNDLLHISATPEALRTLQGKLHVNGGQ
jgi:trk system potassium uptake protein TrkA